MERKIRPWINKKIIEYIGEPEPTLVDFICSKVLAGSQPQVILEDVQMVNIFFVKVLGWRKVLGDFNKKIQRKICICFIYILLCVHRFFTMFLDLSRKFEFHPYPYRIFHVSRQKTARDCFIHPRSKNISTRYFKDM